MSFLSWLITKLGGSTSLSGTEVKVYADEYALLAGDIYIREMAFLGAANLVSKAVSKCEFKTYVNGKEKKGSEWYLWNVEPNQNQNSSEFIQQLIFQLLRNPKKGALVIEQGGRLYVADDFCKTPYALYEDIFTQVTVKDFTFSRSFAQSEVLYFKLCDSDIKQVLDGLYDSYSKLITYSMNAYQRSKGTKVKFKYDTLPAAGTEQRQTFDALVNEKIGKWLNSDNAALPLGKGQDVEEMTQKTYSSDSTRDIRALIEDISDFTAKAFGIPPVLLRGEVQGTSEAVDQFLTFCIDPLTDMLAEEINRKRNGKAAYLSGTYLRIDTKQIKHVDMMSVATSIDKLIGSGAFCVNDIRIVCNESPIDEPWAWEHYITKNYEPFKDALNGANTGGEI